MYNFPERSTEKTNELERKATTEDIEYLTTLKAIENQLYSAIDDVASLDDMKDEYDFLYNLIYTKIPSLEKSRIELIRSRGEEEFEHE